MVIYITEADILSAKMLCATTEKPININDFKLSNESELVIVGTANAEMTLFSGQTPQNFARKLADALGANKKQVKEIFLFGDNLNSGGTTSLAFQICQACKANTMKLLVHAFATPQKSTPDTKGEIKLEVIERNGKRAVKVYYKLQGAPIDDFELIIDTNDFLSTLRLSHHTHEPKKTEPSQLSYDVAKALWYLDRKSEDFSRKNVDKEAKKKRLHYLSDGMDKLYNHPSETTEELVHRLKHRLGRRLSRSHFCTEVVDPLEQYLKSDRTCQQKLIPEYPSSEELMVAENSGSSFSLTPNRLVQTAPVQNPNISDRKILSKSAPALPQVFFPGADSASSSSQPEKSSPFIPISRKRRSTTGPLPALPQQIPTISLPTIQEVQLPQSSEETSVPSTPTRSRSQSLVSHEGSIAQVSPQKIQQNQWLAKKAHLLSELSLYRQRRSQEGRYHYNFLFFMAFIYFIIDAFKGSNYFQSRSRFFKLQSAEKIINYTNGTQDSPLIAVEKEALSQGRLGQIISASGGLEAVLALPNHLEEQNTTTSVKLK